jgi:hypothetical protein
VTDASEAAAADVAEEQPEAAPETGVVDAPETPAPETAVLETPAAPHSPTPPEPVPPPVSRGPGLLAPLVGGALAAIGGFALSHFDAFGLAPRSQGEEVASLEARVADLQAKAEADRAALTALQSQVAPLADRLAALEAAPMPEPPDLSRLDGLDERLAAIEALPTGDAASTAALAARLADLERRLAAQPQGADQAQVDEALARLAEAEAEAARRADEAAAAAEAAARSEALGRLSAAVEAGGPFQGELDAVADPELSQALSRHAAGVATLAGLQADFPDLARQALALARAADADEGWGARLLDFLASQTGARPVTPRQGDTPDAILSRAEFALAEARLADALTEIKTLDPALQAPFAEWIARAEARLAVLAALDGR